MERREVEEMTREEREDAIDIIQSILNKYEEDECLACEITIGDEDIKAFKMAIKALEQEPKWIPVSEKLPMEFETIILSTDKDEVFIADYLGKMNDGSDCFDDNDGMEWEGDVIAWMPLPEPYKAESEE